MGTILIIKKGRQNFEGNMGSSEKEVIEIEEEDEDDRIDEEQLEEYQEMVDQLGTFPVSIVRYHML